MPAQRKILIIEDNAADVRLMREALKDSQQPITIEVADDCEEALLDLRQDSGTGEPSRPNVIFLDFNLPKSDPRDFLRQMKEDEQLRAIPVVVLTTSDAEKDIRDAYALHANCYLRKPLDLDGFFRTIRAAAHFWLEIAYIPADAEEDATESAHLL